jgi:hypothetical protein
MIFACIPLHFTFPSDLPDIRCVTSALSGWMPNNSKNSMRVSRTSWPSPGIREPAVRRNSRWSWEPARELWAGKYGTTGHGGLVISDEYGNIIFVTEPAPGCDHDMAKLEGAAKEILDVAGAVVADKGFQGSGYVMPVKKPAGRELYTREHEYMHRSARSALGRSALSLTHLEP